MSAEYIKEVGHDTLHHFFTAGDDGITTGTSLDHMIQMLKWRCKDADLYRVPLPMFSEYETTADGAPDVPGTVFIGHWGVRKCLTH